MYVISTGMACPVGLSVDAACAAIRAGIANFVELPYLDRQGQPIIGSMIPGSPLEMTLEERLIKMLCIAITNCLKTGLLEDLREIPLLIGLAEPERPGGGAGLKNSIIHEVERRLKCRFHPRLSGVITRGHTSSFEALALTRTLFQRGEVSTTIICGVDSYINARSLLWLDNHLRLKTAYNSDGIIPGEMASAALIKSSPTGDVVLKITGVGFGYESANVLSEEPFLAYGLTEAARAALKEAEIQMHEVDMRISDITGESYSFKEQSLMLARLMRSRKEEMPIWHVSDSIGDTGAAVGTCLLATAFYGFKKNYAPGRLALCFTSSVAGSRAAVILQHLSSETAGLSEYRQKGLVK